MLRKPNPQAQSEDDTLSAFFDGELSDVMLRQTSKHLLNDAAARARHAEYCAVGDALRGIVTAPSNFTARIMAALEDEPTILAPMRRKASRQPMLWLAAASVAALTWGLWAADPKHEATEVQLAANQPSEVQALLAAHEDFAQAVTSAPDMHYSRVSLTEIGQ